MKKINNEQGFTLVEAIIATAILGIGIITLISMQTTTVKGNAKAKGITTAANWAQAKIEDFLNWDYENITPDPDLDTDAEMIVWCQAHTSDPCFQSVYQEYLKGQATYDWYLQHYPRTWAVFDDVLPSVPIDPITNQPYLKQIQVTVTKSDFSGSQDIMFNYYKQNNM